jgi:hypothetical protein
MDRSSLQSSSALRFCGPVISTASARRRWLLRAVQSRRNRGSAADSHPADSPAMAVPETLCHPFATAKIVVWPGTRSVRGGLIIAARSRDACGDATLHWRTYFTRRHRGGVALACRPSSRSAPTLNPHSARCQPVPNFPRLRALVLFGRRPSRHLSLPTVSSLPASKKTAQ